jgi:hypothetical protein
MWSDILTLLELLILGILFCIGSLVAGIVLLYLFSIPDTRREKKKFEEFGQVALAEGWNWKGDSKTLNYHIDGSVGEVSWRLQAKASYAIVDAAPGHEWREPFQDVGNTIASHGRYEFEWLAENIGFPQHIVSIQPRQIENSEEQDEEEFSTFVQHLLWLQEIKSLAELLSISEEQAQDYYERMEKFSLGDQEFQGKYVVATTNRILAERILTSPVQQILIDQERFPRITYWWGGIRFAYLTLWHGLDLERISAVIEFGLKLIESAQNIEASAARD